MERVCHCALSASPKSPGQWDTLSFGQHVVRPMTQHIEEIRKRTNFALHPGSSSHSAQGRDSYCCATCCKEAAGICVVSCSGPETRGKISPPWSLGPCLPLQAGDWALGHCSAPTWCEIAPPWHSACTFHGRRLPPPWPGYRHKLLTDPHCSCGGETMSVRRAAGHQGGQAPTAEGTDSQLWGEDCVEHRLLEV